MSGRSNILTAAVLALMSLVSCSKAKLNKDVVAAGDVEVSMTVSWPETAIGKPDQVYIVANRLVGTKHFGYLYPDFTPVDPAAEQLPQSMVWPNGEYYIVCFTKDEEMYRTTNLMEFPKNNKISLKDISVSLPELTPEEKAGLFDPGMRDFNPSAEFVRDAGHFYSTLNIQKISPAHTTDIALYPKNMTQYLRIRFAVKLSDGVRINSVKTFISGVARHIHPMTGIVNYRDLYKVAMSVSGLGVGGTVNDYVSTANVFGLFPAESAEALTGNGIFQVILSANLGDEEKIFYAAINLKKTITDAKIMKLTDDMSGYVIGCSSATLKIDDVLTITKDGVIGSTDADGVDKWFVQEYIDVEM